MFSVAIWKVTAKTTSPWTFPQNLWMLPYLEKGLCRGNEIKNLEIRSSSGIIFWALNPITRVLTRMRPREIFQNKGRDDVATEADIGMMWPHALQCLQPTKAIGRDEEWILQNLWKERGLDDTSVSDFWPPEVGENKFLLF